MLDLLRQLPIRDLTDAQLWFRNTFATGAWPEDATHVETPTSVSRADALLQDAHFEDASGYSLKYEGEVLNLRRPAGYSEDGVPLEVHLRARFHPTGPAGLQWIGHREASRFNAKHEHVHHDGLEWLTAGEVATILEAAGIPTTPDS